MSMASLMVGRVPEQQKIRQIWNSLVVAQMALNKWKNYITYKERLGQHQAPIDLLAAVPVSPHASADIEAVGSRGQGPQDGQGPHSHQSAPIIEETRSLRWPDKVSELLHNILGWKKKKKKSKYLIKKI